MRKIAWCLARNGVLCNFGLFLSKFGCHGNFLGSFEILDRIFEVADTDNLTIHVKNSLISCTQLKSVCLFLLKFGCHDNSTGSLEILYSIFEFTGPQNLTIYAINSSIPCTQLNSVQFLFFCLYLVAMATPLAPLKIEVAYLNSPTLYTTVYCEKFLHFLHSIEICAIFAYFCLNLVAMATFLALLKF